MEVFKGMERYDHEQILFTYEPSVGYKGIIPLLDYIREVQRDGIKGGI